MQEGVDWKKPAFIGGLIVGVLSLIPIVNYANCCFCLWALVGGAVAAKMLIDVSVEPLTSSDGAKIGLFAGLIGGGIYVVIGGPLAALSMDTAYSTFSARSDLPPEALRFIQQLQQNVALKVVVCFIGAIIGAIFLAGFTTLGGLIGVALFEKRKGNDMPPPPPQYPPPPPPQYPPQYPRQYPPNYPPSAPPPPPSAPPSDNEGGEPEGGNR